MADFTVSTNLISWVLARQGLFGWPNDSAVRKLIAAMQPGDVIVPKFAQSAGYEDVAGHHNAYQKRLAEVFGVDYDAALSDYNSTVQSGQGAVPFVMRVVDLPTTREGEGKVPKADVSWSVVEIEKVGLDYPISTSEYLRLRAIPVGVAIQFKATAAPGRHIQELPEGAGETVLAVGKVAQRGTDELRSESLVRADSAVEAVELLAGIGHPPRRLDRAFIFSADRMLGLHRCDVDGTLVPEAAHIERAPSTLRPLFEQASSSKRFKAQRALHAADELTAALDSEQRAWIKTEFGHFHDRYVLLPAKVTAALDIVSQSHNEDVDPPTIEDSAEDEDGGATAEELTIEQVEGLGVDDVRKHLPPGVLIADSVLAETVTALRAGKHLILSGPPGTGKSTLATAVCQAVGASYRAATATADWSTVDTIGAYLPDGASGLRFEEGIVLTALSEDSWLIIDELNRADIDKAFGPLFTLLAGAGGSGAETVTLPYRRNGQRIEIGWAATLSQATTAYAVTRGWRLIGTMNDSDKASLFGLSFAFLRRFAVIDVGLPEEATYSQLLTDKLPKDPIHDPANLLAASMRVAHGPIRLGPAILLDIAEFTRRGITSTATNTTPYETAAAAFLTAVRLYAVPQYEGAESKQSDTLKKSLAERFPEPPVEPWNRLTAALDRAAIAEF